MIIFNGEKWVAPKYKITQPVVLFDDETDGYENATIEENKLSSEQLQRLKDIEFLPLPEQVAKEYVKTGDGVFYDDRTETDKLIDLIPVELIDKTVIDLVPHWEDGYYGIGRYVYLGGLYRSIKITNKSPKEVPENWEEIGGTQDVSI